MPAPTASARRAGLTYVSDTQPGWRRRRAGKGFRYRDDAGKPIHDPAALQRIKSLVIPPAWEDVWICPRADGHLQATGRDAKGRKQYRYHPRWRAARDETKFDRMVAFAHALPRLRAALRRDLARPGLPRRKVIATIVRLLETSLIRVGNEEYTRQNGSFGLTTLRNRHVKVNHTSLRFEFRGKGGVKHSISVRNRRLARIVTHCRDLPGQELFQYVDRDGQRRSIGSADVNAYVRAHTGQGFTAKDFRTWAGTTLAVQALLEHEACHSQAQAKRNVVAAIDAVSQRLGNTRAICRKSYVHPAVIDSYLAHTLSKVAGNGSKSIRGLNRDEAVVVAVLRNVARQG
jgi:DNA topoisomerase-1